MTRLTLVPTRSNKRLDHYHTGYGEVHQPLRAGANQAMQLPSRGIGA